ncbi:MAG TPA: alpha/beta fold hydrolase [Pseudonocardiaceae bacterium]|nr:alpha/beta fold hydrolase [Pseudonocardiaceae bacterium]
MTRWDDLVPLVPHQGDRPVYLVHPVSGSVFCYLLLARSLGRRWSCWAFACPAPPPGNAVLEELARRYAAQIDPSADRPVLGGWSLGGLIAFEMARQLREQGHDLGPLMLIDASVPGSADHDEDAVVAFAADFATMTGQPEAAARVLAAPAAARTEQLWELMRQQDPELDAADAQRRLDTFRWHSKAFADYEPRGRVRGPALVLTAADNATEGWSRWIEGPVTAERLTADHYGVLRRPAVHRISELLEEVSDA